jgi:hypothetical protein
MTKSFLTVIQDFQMVGCTSRASRFEVTVVFVVYISFPICTLNNIPFVFGRFEFYFALLYIFYIEYVFVIPGWFQVYKEH